MSDCQCSHNDSRLHKLNMFTFTFEEETAQIKCIYIWKKKKRFKYNVGPAAYIVFTRITPNQTGQQRTFVHNKLWYHIIMKGETISQWYQKCLGYVRFMSGLLSNINSTLLPVLPKPCSYLPESYCCICRPLRVRGRPREYLTTSFQKFPLYQQAHHIISHRVGWEGS